MEDITPNYISHYYEKLDGPFKSMTDNGLENSIEVFNKLKLNTNTAKSKFPNSYPKLRSEVEHWLINGFKEKGGKPIKQNPHYSVLGDCKWLLSWYLEGAKKIIPLSYLKDKQVSFTYCDSMISYQHRFQYEQLKSFKGDYKMEEYYGKVYLLDELHEVISRFGYPSAKINENGRPSAPDMYIEIQIWEDLVEFQ